MLQEIDNGEFFDFGRVSEIYGQYRDIYPESMYNFLRENGIGLKGQKILDLGSGTAVLPLNMVETGAEFVSTDISKNQIEMGKRIVEERKIKNINFKVCSAEETGFDKNTFDAVTAVQCFHYFDQYKAADEISRILKPNGIFCKIFMDWLPYEDKIVNEMEQTVLKYNPSWSGGGFRFFEYSYPDWAKNRFIIDTVKSYNEYLNFSKEEWIGRILTCRGVGASLNEKKFAQFKREYEGILSKYGDKLSVKHQIHIEIYRKI